MKIEFIGFFEMRRQPIGASREAIQSHREAKALKNRVLRRANTP